MALDQITSKILDDAKHEKARILQEAGAEKTKIIKAAEEQAALARRQILEKAREEADSRRRTAFIKSQMELKKRILTAKREMLDSVFEKAIEALPSLPSNEYSSFLQKILIQAIVNGNEEVRLNSQESKRLGGEFWKQVSDALRASGRKAGLKTVIDDSVADGFLIRGEREQIDCRFPTLIGALRQEMETDVARILFGDSANAYNT
jgi:V/A-type H+/Na+-transporting ATPase subunit E